MVFWIVFIIILLIILEEGLYFLSNRVAFNRQSKDTQLNHSVEETSNSRRTRRLRRKH